MPKILIIDDAHIIHMRLRQILAGVKCECFTADDGIEGVEMCKEIKPDLVTLDITMPRLNGLETLKKIIEVAPSMKIIIISAMGQKQLVLQALELGARDFIVKPFDKERVLETVQKILNA